MRETPVIIKRIKLTNIQVIHKGSPAQGTFPSNLTHFFHSRSHRFNYQAIGVLIKQEF